MYNAHRANVPGAPSGGRLTELLEQVRQEFDNEINRSREFEGHFAQQVQEMEMVRNRIFHLEQQFQQTKNKYEEEVSRLHRELEARGGPSQNSHIGGPQHGGPSQPPPSIGHGPSNLFGGIMAGGQGGPGLAPPQEQAQTQGLPPHMAQGPPGLNPAPGPPQHPPFSGYQAGPGVNGYGPQGAQPGASPGGATRNNVRGPQGPATPQQGQAAPYPGSPRVGPTPPPNQNHMAMTPMIPDVGNMLAELDVDALPEHYKKMGNDWFAIFNPRVRRQLDVNLLHTFPHQSVVCCVRFSLDGRYVATGCNRSAQIYDVRTGDMISHLQDGSLTEDGDLYIRSVCFSPDGRYLATGAEDRVIRVWDINSRQIRHRFSGHDQDIYSLDFARNGRLIASGSGDKTVRLWDIHENQQVMELRIEDGVTTVAISPDNRWVAAGSLDKSVRVWNVQTGYLHKRLEGEEGGHTDSVYSVAFAPNGHELVSGSLDKTIKMWDLGDNRVHDPGQKGRCIRTFEGHKDFVLSVALTQDNAWVLSGSKDRGVQFWDPHTGVAQLMLQGHKNSVISVAPSPAGGLFATGSGDMRARIWSYDQIPQH